MADHLMAFVVIYMMVLLSIPSVSADEDTIVIKPVCPVPPYSVPCLTLTNFAHSVEYHSANITLELLPGHHSLDSNIKIFNVTSFTMLGSSFSVSSPVIGEPTVTVRCSGPVSLSFNDSQEVRLQAIEFIQCGGVYQPAITVSSVQYFEMIDCSLKDSRSVGLLANRSTLAVHSTSFNNSSSTGLIVLNAVANFTGNNTFANNSHPFGGSCFNDYSVSCGGGFAAFDSIANFLGITTLLGNAAEYGGGMYVSRSTFTLDGHQHFVQNSGFRGGGMFAKRSTLFFVGHGIQATTSFVDNSATHDGGGVYLESATIHCNHTMSFDHNAAQQNGGGTYLRDSVIVIDGYINYAANSAGFRGGGLYAQGSEMLCDGTLIFDSNIAGYGGAGVSYYECSISLSGRPLFRNNSASYGGGLYIQHSSMVLEGHIILDGNVAQWYGGGIYVSSFCSLSFKGNTSFRYNHAISGGGVRIAHDSVMQCNGSTGFVHNSAYEYGGGLLVIRSTISFHGSTILMHNSASSGGGVAMRYSSILSSEGKMVLDANTARLRGGGIDASLSSLVSFKGSAFLNNNSAFQGGGMNVRRGDVACSGTIIFQGNRAGDTGGGIDASYYVNLISLSGNVTFRDNRAVHGGGIIAGSSTLVCDGNIQFYSNTAGQLGGGLIAFLSSFVSLSGNVMFVNNSAFEGGGLAIEGSHLTCSGSTYFYNNLVSFLGGAIVGLQSSLNFSGSTELTSNSAFQGGGMSLTECHITSYAYTLFERNTAQYFGGGMMFFASRSPCTLCNVGTFHHSVKFLNNSAVFGGGFLSLDGKVTFSGNTCFSGNSAVLSVDKSGYGGGFFCYRSTVSFLAESIITNNVALDGGGMYGSYTVVSINGGMRISGNSALANGGGLYFTSESECQLMENASLVLTQNYAGQFGGAIYLRDDPFFSCISVILPTIDYPGDTDCFFQPTTWPTSASIRILDNYAEQAGSLLYGGNLERCNIKVWTSSVYRQAIFDWIFNNHAVLNETAETSLISSYPIRVCPCISSQPDCDTNQQHFTVFPGEKIHIFAVATGQTNGTVPSVITARVTGSDISIESHQYVQSANKTCTTLEYRIFPREGYDHSVNYTMNFHSESPCQSYGIPVEANIKLLPCPSGFDLSQSQYMSCVCSQRVQRYTSTCDIDTQTILRHGQYWIGWDTTSNGAILHPHCPFDYCTSENTSFPMNDTDSQCQHNRAGLLCGGCKDGHSLGFGSSRCLKCSTNYFLSLLLAFTIAGIVLVVLLLTCKLTVAMGTINGLVFYANIVAASQTTYFPQHNSHGDFLRIFITWINLDLGIESCFYRGMDMYTRTWLQFVFPLYIWTIVAIVTVLCHYFSWATRMFGRNPVAVLATLFLLSYTKLLRTVITITSFTYLDYPDNPTIPVWLYDGNVVYVDGRHIALFVAALLVLLFLFLPYTFVILCGQWIQARSQHRVFRWINDYRVKAFLDAYYGPLKTNHRYWPGLLLASRALLLLVFAINAFGDPSINLLATIMCVLGLLTLLLFTGSVYKHISIYILEVSFLVNTLVLTASSVTPALTNNQPALTYTSVGIAFATFIGILVYHTLIQVRSSRVWKYKFKPWLKQRQKGPQPDAQPEEERPKEGSADKSQATVTTTTVDLRELALEDKD